MDGVKAQYDRLARKQGKTFEEMAAEQKEKIRRGEIQKKTVEQEVCYACGLMIACNFACNFKARAGQWRHYVIQICDLIYNMPRFLFNYSVGLVSGNVASHHIIDSLSIVFQANDLSIAGRRIQ